MSIDNITDYMAAVAKRQRLQRFLRDDARTFYGYGRELFESSVSRSLTQINDAISSYELRLGYTALAPRNFWTNRVKAEYMTLTGNFSFEKGATICPQASRIEVRTASVHLPISEPVLWRPGSTIQSLGVPIPGALAA